MTWSLEEAGISSQEAGLLCSVSDTLQLGDLDPAPFSSKPWFLYLSDEDGKQRPRSVEKVDEQLMWKDVHHEVHCRWESLVAAWPPPPQPVPCPSHSRKAKVHLPGTVSVMQNAPGT